MDWYTIYIHELYDRIKGGDLLHAFTRLELIMVQELALDIKDIQLYDKIASYLNQRVG